MHHPRDIATTPLQSSVYIVIAHHSTSLTEYTHIPQAALTPVAVLVQHAPHDLAGH